MMTSDSRAVSTASRLTTLRPLISSTRVTRGDLCEEQLDEPEIPAGDAVDGGDGFGVGEVVCGQRQAECCPVALQNEG